MYFSHILMFFFFLNVVISLSLSRRYLLVSEVVWLFLSRVDFFLLVSLSVCFTLSLYIHLSICLPLQPGVCLSICLFFSLFLSPHPRLSPSPSSHFHYLLMHQSIRRTNQTPVSTHFHHSIMNPPSLLTSLPLSFRTTGKSKTHQFLLMTGVLRLLVRQPLHQFLLMTGVLRPFARQLFCEGHQQETCVLETFAVEGVHCR